MKFLVVDGHALFRRALVGLLNEIDGSVDVIEASSQSAAFDLIADDDEYDAVLFDVSLPGDSYGGLTRFVERLPDVSVVALAASDELEQVEAAISAGASGYLSKTTSIDVMRNALAMMIKDPAYVPMPAAAVRRIAAATLSTPPMLAMDDNVRELLAALTRRQREVLGLVAQGFSNRDIADRLGMLENTVKVHVRDILRKLKVANRTQAALIANAAPSELKISA